MKRGGGILFVDKLVDTSKTQGFPKTRGMHASISDVFYYFILKSVKEYSILMF